uniref:Uncharacterized protein n=1 Tax=Macaca fascicularis TaxID=9541 RepID=A0A7N9D5A3_MACFA
CWYRLSLNILSGQNFEQCTWLCICIKNICRVHVHNVQVCYICILVPCCCAAPIDSSFTINSKFTLV